ncbi:MAG: glycerol-3-phosphate 1-O-acyltransferase PlsY [Ruminococcaceae bacterium]|nr:glycerol-3-phosphate 1-O-acyltransferase PlsY [Oscillospiraceae bacterium]
MWDLLIQNWHALLLTAVGAYLMGSMNWAIILTRLFKKTDIRATGSGNAGATNVLRSQGPVLAALTLVGDVGKGVLATLLGGWLMTAMNVVPDALPHEVLLVGRYAASLFVVLGHMYPVFHKFRGGKGVATSAGLIFVLDWRAGAVCLSMFILILLLGRMVSLGSVMAVGLAPFVTFAARRWIDGYNMGISIFCTLMITPVVVIVIAKHSANMRRIADGTESRIDEMVKKDEPEEQ